MAAEVASQIASTTQCSTSITWLQPILGNGAIQHGDVAVMWGKDHDCESDGGLSGDGMSESDEDLCFDYLDDNYAPEDSDMEHLDDEVQSECVEFIWNPLVNCQIPSYICNGLITNLRTQSFSIWCFLTTFDSKLSVLSTLKVNSTKFHPYLGEKFCSNSKACRHHPFSVTNHLPQQCLH